MLGGDSEREVTGLAVRPFELASVPSRIAVDPVPTLQGNPAEAVWHVDDDDPVGAVRGDTADFGFQRFGKAFGPNFQTGEERPGKEERDGAIAPVDGAKEACRTHRKGFWIE